MNNEGSVAPAPKVDSGKPSLSARIDASLAATPSLNKESERKRNIRDLAHQHKINQAEEALTKRIAADEKKAVQETIDAEMRKAAQRRAAAQAAQLPPTPKTQEPDL